MQTPAMRRSSITDSSHHHLPSSLPRPVISTDVDAYRSNAVRNVSSPIVTTTPEAINYYRKPPSSGDGLLPSHSFDATSGRSVSESLQNTPRQAQSQPRLVMPKRSVRDLATQFDQASNGMVPLPVRPRDLRTVSASAAASSPVLPSFSPRQISEPRHHRKLQKSPPKKRESRGTSEHGGSRRGSTPSSPTGTFGSSLQGYGRSEKSEFLFGEIDTRSSSSSKLAYGIPHERSRRVSEGGIYQSGSAFLETQTGTADGAAHSTMRPESSHVRSTSDSTGSPLMMTTGTRYSLQQSAPGNFIEDMSRQNASEGQGRHSRIPLPRQRDHRQQPRFPTRRSTTPPPRMSYRQFDATGVQVGHEDQRFRAFVTEPSPQQSPPLRSSRPRQQVSSVAQGAASSFGSYMSSARSESRDSIIDDRTYTPPEFPSSSSRRDSYAQTRAGSREGADPVTSLSLPHSDTTTAGGHDIGRLQQLSNAIYYGAPAVQQRINSSASESVIEHRQDSSGGLEGPSTDIEDDANSSPLHSSFDGDQDSSLVQSQDHMEKEPAWPKPPILSIQTQTGTSRKPPILISGPGEPSPAMSADEGPGERIHIKLDPANGDTGASRISHSSSTNVRDQHDVSDGSGGTSSATPIQHDLHYHLATWTPDTAQTPYSGLLPKLDVHGYNQFLNIIREYATTGDFSPQMMEDVERHETEANSSISPRELVQGLIDQGSLLPDTSRDSTMAKYISLYPTGDINAQKSGSVSSPGASRLSVHTDIEDNASSAAEDDRRDAPVSALQAKSTMESPQVDSDDGTTSSTTQKFDRFSTQTHQSTNSDHPSLPEIQDTGGGLGFFAGDTQRAAGSNFASATSFPVELAAGQSPRQPSGSFSIASSEAQQAASGLGMTTPDRQAHDTPATSVSHPPSFRSADQVPRSTSVDRDLALSTNTPSSAKDVKRLTQRRYCINELINTEFTYHRDMTVVEDIYIATASSCSDLSDEDTRVLFGNTAQLVSFSRQLADSLKEASRGVYQKAKKPKDNHESNRASRSTSSSGQTGAHLEGTDEERDRQTYVGEVFLQNMGALEKIYADYLRNHDAANQRLAKIISREGAKIWLNECHNYAKDLTGAWNLDSMLIKPTQRILKYALLLDSVLKETPEDHPDYTALAMANKEMINVTQRINDAKKRAELVDQIVNPRTRKDLDMTKGLQKAFGRRADKMRQQVGITEAVEDPDYRAIAQKFGSQFLQLQVAMKDVEVYLTDGHVFMKQYGELATSFEDVIDVGPSRSPEIESKWRRWAMTVRELFKIAWADHTAAVQKHCVEPMRTLLGMFGRPQTLMTKRKKRLAEYAKYKTMKEKGEKVDKKSTEQAEQFMALNETLKDELPKLFATSARLVEACLKNFIHLSTSWNETWRRKMTSAVDDYTGNRSWDEIIADFKNDHQYLQEDVTSLGICNGSLIHETSNFLASSTTIDRDEGRSRRPSFTSSARKQSSASQTSTAYPPTASNRTSGGSYPAAPYGPRPSTDSTSRAANWSNSHAQHQRLRSHSGSTPHRKPVNLTPPMRPPPIPNQEGTFFFGQTPPATTAAAQSYEAASRMQPNRQHTPIYQSQQAASYQPQQPLQQARPSSSNTHYTASSSNTESRTARSSVPSQHRTPPLRSPNVFSSALPMMDGANDSRPPSEVASLQSPGMEKPYKVLFLAASLYDFTIDGARTEAGYRYLTYVPGEIFDVIGEKGELWLAKNQDDPTSAIGWIWEKHFAKLVSTDVV